MTNLRSVTQSRNRTYWIDDEDIAVKCRYSLPLLELSEAEAHPDYCVDAAVNGSRFLGTAAAYCATKEELVCEDRPCVPYCCLLGEVLKVQAQSKRRDRAEKQSIVLKRLQE
jgi:hypothetical protein